MGRVLSDLGRHRALVDAALDITLRHIEDICSAKTAVSPCAEGVLRKGKKERIKKGIEGLALMRDVSKQTATAIVRCVSEINHVVAFAETDYHNATVEKIISAFSVGFSKS
jgi:hypothetical protein